MPPRKRRRPRRRPRSWDHPIHGPRNEARDKSRNCRRRGGRKKCDKDFEDKIACVSWWTCRCEGGNMYGEWSESREIRGCSPKYKP